MNFPSKAGSSCCITEDYTKSIPHPCLQILGTSVLSELRILSLTLSQDFYATHLYSSDASTSFMKVSIDISNFFQTCIFLELYSCQLLWCHSCNHDTFRKKRKKQRPKKLYFSFAFIIIFLPKISFTFFSFFLER